MQQPPDSRHGSDAPERKFRSRRRAEAAARPPLDPAQPSEPTEPQRTQLPPPQPGQSRPPAPPTLVRSSSATSRRIDILLPSRQEAGARSRLDDAPLSRLSGPPRAADAEFQAKPPEYPRPRNAEAPLSRLSGTPARQPESAPASPEDPPRLSRFVRVERDRLHLPKGLWSSLLIGVLGVAAVVALFTLGGKWMRDYREQEAERQRAETEARERASYPLHFQELIEENAETYGLDPALVAAVIKCESDYRSDAVSYLGAQGLMQIMPDTAQWIAETLDEPGFTEDRVFEPEVNIRFGSWFLSYLLRLFDGNLTNSICAYHAGQGNVAAWLQQPEYSDDGVTLKKAADNDTADYLAKVLKAITIYQKHYYPIDG